MDYINTLKINNTVYGIEAWSLVGDVAKKIIPIEYNQLKELRDNKNLIPGTWYRITDYHCTTMLADTSSADHQFDILVLANSENTLNEDAFADIHEGDTYFANSNLGAWQIKYSLDNNASKFDWADNTNGKGVIYWMKDEWNNEAPYDFKNIRFKRWKVDRVVDNTSYLNSDELNSLEVSLKGKYILPEQTFSCSSIKLECDNYDDYKWLYTFDISGSDASLEIYVSAGDIVIKPYRHYHFQTLNNIVIERANGIFGELLFEENCYDITVIGSGSINLEDCCNDIIIADKCENIKIGNSCCNILIGTGCDNINIGSNNGDIYVDAEDSYITTEYGCYNIIFGQKNAGLYVNSRVNKVLTRDNIRSRILEKSSDIVFSGAEDSFVNKDSNEKLRIWNPADPNMTITTYKDLKDLRYFRKLIPGMWYRITDYKTTTKQEGTDSAGNPFDVIVMADSESTLNENAHAYWSISGSYFGASNLSAWEIKYSLDNDTDRFAWADSKGTGVIYYMKDEFGNEAPYDFKNIRFARYDVGDISQSVNIIPSDYIDSVKSSVTNRALSRNPSSLDFSTFSFAADTKPRMMYTFGGDSDRSLHALNGNVKNSKIIGNVNKNRNLNNIVIDYSEGINNLTIVNSRNISMCGYALDGCTITNVDDLVVGYCTTVRSSINNLNETLITTSNNIELLTVDYIWGGSSVIYLNGTEGNRIFSYYGAIFAMPSSNGDFVSSDGTNTVSWNPASLVPVS